MNILCKYLRNIYNAYCIIFMVCDPLSGFIFHVYLIPLLKLNKYLKFLVLQSYYIDICFVNNYTE